MSVPSRDHQLSVAELHPTLRARPVLLQARRAAERLTGCSSTMPRARGAKTSSRSSTPCTASAARTAFCKVMARLQCTTCHNPHDVPRGAEADAALRRSLPQVPRCRLRSGSWRRASTRARPVAPDCHMPKRRTEDVVHSAATDHYIQRRRPAGDLLAEMAERHETGDKAYRGEVVPYYPGKLRPAPDNDLYLGLGAGDGEEQSGERDRPAHGSDRTACLPRGRSFTWGSPRRGATAGNWIRPCRCTGRRSGGTRSPAFGLLKLGSALQTLRPVCGGAPTSCNGLPP